MLGKVSRAFGVEVGRCDLALAGFVPRTRAYRLNAPSVQFYTVSAIGVGNNKLWIK
jgi:hypothetical protein